VGLKIKGPIFKAEVGPFYFQIPFFHEKADKNLSIFHDGATLEQ
jgi:hypothetical protein